jgi:DNA topoisomerase-1
MEAELDEIEDGEKPWVETVRQFYQPFAKRLDKAQHEMRDVKREAIPTEVVCEKCGKQMVIKWGRHGRFLACPGYPECRNTKEFVEKEGRVEVVDRRQEVDERCPNCTKPLMIKTGRFGRFLACSGYPDCRFTKPVGTGVACPQPDCGGELVEKRSGRGKIFYGCSRYPNCTFASWDRPVARPCPQCQRPFLVQKYSKATGPRIVCPDRACGYQEEPESPGEELAAAESGRPGRTPV